MSMYRRLGVPVIIITTLLSSSAVPFCDTTEYRIRRGETLYSIARRFDVSLEELLSVNGITDPTRIRAGALIRIPSAEGEPSGDAVGVYHTVRKGDTLYALSRRYGVNLDDLLAANNLSRESVIRIDDRLLIPGRKPEEEKRIPKEETSPPGGTEAEGRLPFWPHPGERQNLEGKLSSAIAIVGKQGDRVVSVSSGRVTWAAPFRGYGKMIFVKSQAGYIYGYGGHRELLVGVGDEVRPGMEIGILGINPHDGVAKVFFLVMRNGKPSDPSKAPRS